jgi:hypothetical protein
MTQVESEIASFYARKMGKLAAGIENSSKRRRYAPADRGDTPQNGCCAATLVPIWKTFENSAFLVRRLFASKVC